MSDKKYYWLKLKDDFFNKKEIKRLRRIAGGDTYTIIYLKMLLLSLKEEGSGTTGKMAKLNDRNYILIDSSEEYNNIANKRISELEG